MKTALVLGGGGIKGLAHIGAWKALLEADVRVSEITGTSIGALVAVCLAAGQSVEELEQKGLALKKSDIVSLNGRALLINGIRQQSVFRDDALRRYIDRVLPVKSFDELEIPVSMNAVDLETGHITWFGAGGRTDVSLADAIYASCALPVFYPPARIEGRYFVDGGVSESLPIEWARSRGAKRVIAIDVSAGEVKDSLDVLDKGMVAISHRVFDIMAHARRAAQLAAWDGIPLTYVRPRLDGISTFDFTRTRYFLDEGYRATRASLSEELRIAASAD
jgi:NTE family protein